MLLGDNINSIANIYFLLSELCDNMLFERNVLFETQSEVNFPHFGKIIMTCLEWVEKYRSFNKSVEIIEISILFFMEKVVN